MVLVRGPTNLTVHSSARYNKKWAIFGETHRALVTCPPGQLSIPIHTYLRQVFREHLDTVVDFFLESPVANEEEEFNRTDTIDLSTLQEDFRNCLKIDKSLCNLPNVRVHYTDVRQTREMEALLAAPISWVENTAIPQLLKIQNDVMHEQYFTRLDRAYEIIKAKEQELKGVLQSPLIKKLATSIKLTKQLTDVPFPEVRLALKEFWNDQIRAHMEVLTDAFAQPFPDNNNVEKRLGASSILRQIEIELLKNRVRRWHITWINMTGRLLDVFTLARMFRCFAPRAGLKLSGEPTHIFFYGGTLHAEGIRLFLQNYLPASSVTGAVVGKDMGFKCLEIPATTWPSFFSAFPPSASSYSSPCPVKPPKKAAEEEKKATTFKPPTIPPKTTEQAAETKVKKFKPPTRART